MVYDSESLGFWTCFIFWNSKQRGCSVFQKLYLSPSSDEGKETPTLLGLSERANLNHWTITGWSRSVLIKGPNKVDISLPSPEDGDRSSFQNIVFSSYLEFLTMDQVQKANDSKSDSWCLKRGAASQVPFFFTFPFSISLSLSLCSSPCFFLSFFHEIFYHKYFSVTVEYLEDELMLSHIALEPVHPSTEG
jgi:hypothetical protein